MGFKNTRQQGDAGVGAAISYCTALGRVVALPIGEGQRYDLVVESEAGQLLRLQCKTAFGTNNFGNYQADLRTSGGNRSGGGKVTRISADEVDCVSILDGAGRLWWFSASQIAGRSTVTVSKTRYGENLCYDPSLAVAD